METTIYLFLSISLDKITISFLTKHATCILDKITINVFIIKILKIVVRTKKSSRPSPLRTVSCTIQPWPKSMKFVRKGNKQQERALPEDQNKEEKANVIK